MADPTRPAPSNKKLTQPDPGQKFWPDPITNNYEKNTNYISLTSKISLDLNFVQN